MGEGKGASKGELKCEEFVHFDQCLAKGQALCDQERVFFRHFNFVYLALSETQSFF